MCVSSGINFTSPKTTLDITGKMEAADIDDVIPPRPAVFNRQFPLQTSTKFGYHLYTYVNGGNTISQRINMTSIDCCYFDPVTHV